MPIIGVIGSSWRIVGAVTPAGYEAEANPTGAVAIKKFNFTTETYQSLVPTLNVNQAVAYNDNKTQAGYTNGTSASSGNTPTGYGRNTIKWSFITEVISYITNQMTYGSDQGLLGATSNQGVAGYICGGLEPLATLNNGVATCNKMPYSTETPALISATVSPARFPGPGGVENGNISGFLMGGTTGNGTTVYTTINKMNFSNDTLSTLSATMVTRASSSMGGSFANTAGYCFAGYNNPSDTGAVAKLTFSNETTSQPTSILANRVGWAMTRQTTASYINPGTGGGGNTRKYTFSNDTASTLGVDDGFVYPAGWSNQGA